MMNRIQKAVLGLVFVLGAALGVWMGVAMFGSSSGDSNRSNPQVQDKLLARASDTNDETPAKRSDEEQPKAITKDTNPDLQAKPDTTKQDVALDSAKPVLLAGSKILSDEETAKPKPDDKAETPADSPKQERASEPEKVDLPDGSYVLHITVKGNLYDSVHAAASKVAGYDKKKSDVVAAHIKRILIWYFRSIRRDVFANDRIDLVFREDPSVSDGIRILAMEYYSNKLRKKITAYYFRKKGEKFGRFYSFDGVSVDKIMKNAPVKEYEQITALLGDGRHHKGIDFKAPVGTPIYTPFGARVLRRNWSTRKNGNCLHLRYAKDGTNAIFLHMDKFSSAAKVGAYLEPGTKIGTVGNTGRSYSAHLHYQLEKPKGHVIDPFKWHGYYHKKLKGKVLEQFRVKVGKYKKMLKLGA